VSGRSGSQLVLGGRKQRLLTAGVAVVTVLGTGFFGPAFAGESPVETVSPADAAAAIDELTDAEPELVADPASSTYDKDSAAIVNVNGGGEVVVSRDPGDGIDVTTASGEAIQVALPDEGAGRHTGDGTVVFGDRDGAASMVVPADDGVQILTTIVDDHAATEFRYDLDLPAGATLTTDPGSGVVAILDADGEPIGSFGAPWARDASGAEVPTHYEITAGSLVQVVDHRSGSYAYPVVADPWLGFSLVKSASWTRRDGQWTLMVTPTGWARANGGGYLPGKAGWNELYSKYKNKGLNTNLGGMKDQFICHAQLAFFKPTWNLDEGRKDLSYAATLAWGCNPPYK